jgi:hypothetical protein
VLGTAIEPDFVSLLWPVFKAAYDLGFCSAKPMGPLSPAVSRLLESGQFLCSADEARAAVWRQAIDDHRYGGLCTVRLGDSRAAPARSLARASSTRPYSPCWSDSAWRPRSARPVDDD